MSMFARGGDETSHRVPPRDTYAVTVAGLGAHTARISASGELDLAAADRLAAALDQECVPGSLVQLDLGAVTFMDCSCLRVLIRAYRRYQAVQGSLLLTGIGPRVERLLTLTGLDRALLTATTTELSGSPAHTGNEAHPPVRPEHEGDPATSGVTLEPALLRAIGELAVVGIDGDLDTLAAAEAILGLAARVIGCDHAGLAVLDAHGRVESYVSTRPMDAPSDLWQYEQGQGPGVSARRQGGLVASNHIARDLRWPVWRPRAVAQGFGSVLAVPLGIGRHDLGALSVYATSAEAYLPADRDRAALFATHATTALICVREREQLRIAIDTRTQIGQAQGILMARFGLDPAQALAVLRRYSQDANRKLRDVALDVVKIGDIPTRATQHVDR